MQTNSPGPREPLNTALRTEENKNKNKNNKNKKETYRLFSLQLSLFDCLYLRNGWIDFNFVWLTLLVAMPPLKSFI